MGSRAKLLNVFARRRLSPGVARAVLLSVCGNVTATIPKIRDSQGAFSVMLFGRLGVFVSDVFVSDVWVFFSRTLVYLLAFFVS